MNDTAKIFTTGRSQAVRLPMAYRFDCNEVYIRRDALTGDIVLSRRPDSWDDFFKLDESTEIPPNFMTESDRNQGQQRRDPFEDM
jgi:antitoxin VapB